jgi:hypothetical protein
MFSRRSISTTKGNQMRNLILLGSTAAALMFGAVSAYALPPNSPYAIWEPQAVDGQMYPQSYGDSGPSLLNPFGLFEGRSAYVEREGVAADMTPSQYTSPEDATYFSRGR